MNMAADVTYTHSITGGVFINLAMLAILAVSYYFIATALLIKIERDIRRDGTAVRF